MPIVIRSYEPADETSWLRCRILAFLSTCYYDDVWTRHPPSPAVQLLAMDGDDVVGILDFEIDGDLAMIDTVAVDPDHQGRGVASALLTCAQRELPGTVSVVDAWTREDEPALEWYRAQGFAESEHYLHVYKTWEDTEAGWASPPGLSAPLTAFCHASVQDESDLRGRFSRVYVCRRFSRPVTAK